MTKITSIVAVLEAGTRSNSASSEGFAIATRELVLMRHNEGMTAGSLGLITVDPLVCHGQACVQGTRIPVSIVLDCLGDGMTTAEILSQYPSLTEAGIRAAAAYGAELAREEVLPLSSEQ